MFNKKDPLDKILDDFQFDTKKIREKTTDFDNLETVLFIAAQAISKAYEDGQIKGKKDAMEKF